MPKPAHEVGHSEEYRLEGSLDFMSLLWGIEHGLQSASKRMEKSLGITGPQRLVLRIVEQFPGLSAKSLASIVHLHPSTITGVLQRLVQKGLLERHSDPVDRRRVRLRVRSKSRRFTHRASGTVEGIVDRALSRLPSRHVLHARGVLWSIASALEKDRRH